MKLLLVGIILSTVFITNHSFSQEETAIEIKNSDIVVGQLKVIYGDYYQSLIDNNPDQIKFYADFYERCEFISIEEVPSGFVNISTLNLKDKYNPEIIKHDYMDIFDESKFIALKYQFNFYNKTDEYYLIYNTKTVLKVNKLKL